QRISEFLCDLDRLLMRHDGVAAQDSVWAALFSPTIRNDESRLPFFVNLVVDLGVREHFDVDNVLHIHSSWSLCKDDRREESQDTNRRQHLCHKNSSHVNVVGTMLHALIAV